MIARRWPAALATVAPSALVVVLLLAVPRVLPLAGAIMAAAWLAARTAGVSASAIEVPALVLGLVLLGCAVLAQSPMSALMPYVIWLIVAAGAARAAAVPAARAWAVALVVAGGATIAAYTAIVRLTTDGASRLIVYPAVSHWGHYPEIGILTALVLPLAVSIVLSHRRPYPRIAAGLLSLVLAAGLILTFARASWFAAVVGCAVVAWPHRRRRATVLAVVALAGVVVAGQLAHARLATRDVTIGDAASTRQDAWVAGLSLWRMHPLTGWGPGQYRAAYARTYGADRRPAAETAHNLPIQVGVESGLLGLLALAWLALRVADVAAGRIVDGADPALASSLAAASAVLAARVMFDILDPTSLGLRMFVLSALIVGLTAASPAPAASGSAR